MLALRTVEYLVEERDLLMVDLLADKMEQNLVVLKVAEMVHWKGIW